MTPNIRPASGKTRQMPFTKSGAVAAGELAQMIGDLRETHGGGTINAGRGLSLSVGRKAVRWVFSYMPPRIAGAPRMNQRALVLGDASAIGIDEARALVARCRRDIESGKDPVEAKKAERNARAANVRSAADRAEYDRLELAAIAAGSDGDFSVLARAPIKACIDAFMLHAAGGEEEYRKDTKRHLLRVAKALSLEKAAPTTIQPAAVQSYLRKLSEGHKALPLHVHGSMSRFCEWLRLCRAIENNPMDFVPRPAKPAPRRTVYKAEEVQALWNAADKLPAGKGDYLRFHLLVPLRRQEIANLTAANVHRAGDRLEIRLGGDETKNEEPLTIPLAPAARAIVERLLPKAGNGYLFKLTRGDEMKAWSKFATQVKKASGVAGFSFHHNRRLFTSVCADQQAGDFTVIDGTLNHKSADARAGVRASYMHATMIAPRLRLFTRWEEILLTAIETGAWPEAPQGENVLAFRSAG